MKNEKNIEKLSNHFFWYPKVFSALDYFHKLDFRTKKRMNRTEFYKRKKYSLFFYTYFHLSGLPQKFSIAKNSIACLHSAGIVKAQRVSVFEFFICG